MRVPFLFEICGGKQAVLWEMNHFCKIKGTSHSFIVNIWYSLILNTVLLYSCTQLPVNSLFPLLLKHSEESWALWKEEEEKMCMSKCN